jgi:MFS family permease
LTLSATTHKPGVYYGWYVLATCLFIAFVAAGGRNAFGVFVVPLQKEFDWSRFEISIAAGLGVLLGGVAQPFAGRLFDGTGGRKFILISLVVTGLSVILLSLTFHLLFLIFMFGVVFSIAASGPNLTNTAALLARWFRRQRATVIGWNYAGSSMGGLVLVPLAMFLLQAVGWRWAWAGLGIAVLIAVPLAFMFLRESPAKMGLQPDGEPEGPKSNAGDQEAIRPRGPLEVGRWSESFRSPPIWQLSAAFFVCGTTTTIMSVHFVPYAQDRGVSPGMAAIIFGYMMFLNIIGSIGAGMLSDRFSKKNVLASIYFTRGIAYLVLLLPGILGVPVISGVLGLWLFATFAGISWVATNPPTASLTADVYGLRVMGTLSGVSLLFHQIGGFTTVLLAGLLYDIYGSYTIPFLAAGSLLFPAALSAFSIKERKYSMRYQPQSAPAAAAGD